MARLFALIALAAPALAGAHAFEERYDLPAPLDYFITGAAAVVVLSFVVAQLIMEHAGDAHASQRRIDAGRLLPIARILTRIVALAIFVIAIIAGLYGTSDPLMNLTPTLVWIIVWVGLSLFVACIGNIWPALDPVRTIYDALDFIVRSAGLTRGLRTSREYPQWLGAWPAVVLLLFLAWFEVAYPQAAVPYRLTTALLTWCAFSLMGTILFGAEAWQRNADVFAIYFATLGRFAPLATDGTCIVVRPPGRGLIDEPAPSMAIVCFVLAMLSTVLFDGLMSGQIWQLAQLWLKKIAPFLIDPDGYRMGAVGLISIWLLFLAAFLLTCFVTTLVVRDRHTTSIARLFALTLVPIAIGYNIAHNCSQFVIQAQQLIALASDPLGLKWNLFGTANFHPDIGLIDAQATWYIAIVAIVGGHVIAVWLAHRIALREFPGRKQAAVATVPLTLLMVLYTIVSLSVIAEPMVKFDIPEPVEQQRDR